MFSLFDEPSDIDRDALAERLKELAGQGVWIGGSSWKYEGWLGQIYTPARYYVRGRFSKRAFQAECLAEYASIFPTVCGDFAFYQFPTEDFWRKLFRQTPLEFKWTFKVPEQITCRSFPRIPRYGATGGLENYSFLDDILFKEGFLRALEPWRPQIGLLIFEFGTFAPSAMDGVGQFLDLLGPFLARLPADFRYAVEVRNPEYLVPEYFECLREHRVAHVYNGWSRMPEIADQMRLPGSQTTDITVCRALLRQGRDYEAAVRKFSPYSEVKEVNTPVRRALRELVQMGREDRRTTFVYVNNRLEGNTPGTIVSILDDDPDE